MDPNRVLYAALVIYWSNQLNITGRFRDFIANQAMETNMLSEWEFDEEFKNTVINDDRMKAKEFERLEEKARAYCLKKKSESEREAAKAEEDAAMAETLRLAQKDVWSAEMKADLTEEQKIQCAETAREAMAYAQKAVADAQKAEKAYQKAEAHSEHAVEHADYLIQEASDAADTAQEFQKKAAYARNFLVCVKGYYESVTTTKEVKAAFQKAEGDLDETLAALEKAAAASEEAASSRPSKRPR